MGNRLIPSNKLLFPALSNSSQSMDRFVSSWCDGKTLPESVVFPPEKRPGKHAIPTSKSIPVVDLCKSDGHDHSNVVHQIIQASQDYGFFQVINCGVARRLMDDSRCVFKEFFEPPAEEKSRLLYKHRDQKCVVYTSTSDLY